MVNPVSESRSAGRAKQTANTGAGVQRITALLKAPKNSPVIFRLPTAGGVDPYFCRNRSAWNEIILPTSANGFKPPVKSIVERKLGNAKGRRFIVFESALAYHNKLAAENERSTPERPAAPTEAGQ